MVITEAEAKTKTCCGPPLIAALTLITSPKGFVTAPDAVGKCIGSACMAWRYVASTEGENRIEAIKRRREETHCDLKKALDYVDSHPGYIRKPAPPSGFCGLAGRSV